MSVETVLMLIIVSASLGKVDTGCVDENTFSTYCATIEGRQCYRRGVVDLCCKTCNDTRQKFILIPYCTYGDRIEGCRVEVCGDTQAEQCCATCQAYTLLSTNTTTQVPTPAPEKTKLPAWVIPALVIAGGVIVLLLLCLCCCCCCGKKGHLYRRSRGTRFRISKP